MRRSAHFTFLLCFLFTTARAQMWNGTDTLYGNEWIRYDQSYFKIMVAEDGIYRIPYEALQNSGLPAGGRRPRMLIHTPECTCEFMVGDLDSWIDSLERVYVLRAKKGKTHAPTITREGYTNLLLVEE